MVSLPSESDRRERPSPADFDKFLPWASRQSEAVYNLIVTKIVQSKYVSAVGMEKTKPKTKLKAKTLTDSGSNAQVTSDVQIQESKSVFNEITEEKPIYIETTYENNDLVRVKIRKNKKIPRLLFQVIALAIPYHKTLTSLIVNDGINADGIYEISHFYSTNRITEICLDNTHLPEANYHILLDNDIIKHFSLSKCDITDVVVKNIASKLTSTSPASTSLSILNLATNRITDIGVKYLAEILRYNRHMCYLNLADNKITDEGAKIIFNTLTKFALTSDETLDRRRKLISYLNEKNELVLKTIKDIIRIGDDKKFAKTKSTKLVSTKKKFVKEGSVDLKTYYGIMKGNLFERAEAIAEDTLGPFNDPFGPANTVQEENVTYCLGNNTLSYLNLAFNNLSYCSIKKLCDVLKSQNISCRKPKGLINIRIEGNYLPENCAEFQTIDALLLSGLSIAKNVEPVKRRGASIANKSNN